MFAFFFLIFSIYSRNEHFLSYTINIINIWDIYHYFFFLIKIILFNLVNCLLIFLTLFILMD